ncbi:MAG TPA: class I SAM-dependent methyltransferase [Armatimonadota bacterium]|nr:class I SAM-dependent methyltransferase [Armatimonadota bacterium]
MTSKDKHAEHLAMNRKAWDAYQPDYMEFHLKAHPDFFEYLAGGGVYLDDDEVRLAGDVTGLTVLDVCCASSADEAFSWENLGANVIACDFSPVAVEIAEQNAARLRSRVQFVIADSQELAPIASESVDLVYGRYLCWFEDLEQTLRSWFRVTKAGGRLLLSQGHPIAECLKAEGDFYRIAHKYHDEVPERYDFRGTPLARQHGGWDQSHPMIEFFHPTWRIVNAILDAGYHVLRMEEPTRLVGSEERHADLPHTLFILARKPGA